MDHRIRDALVVVLTVGSGALDAVSFVRLGKVFSSVITGNMALLGVAVGEHQAALALNGGLALAGYAVGVVAASPIARTPERDQPAWPRQVTAALALALLVLIVFSVLWVVSGPHRGTWSRLVLLVLGAVAMGMQGTAVRRLGSMSSTYLTSTLTGVLTAVTTLRPPADWQRGTGSVVAKVAGAVLGALAAAGTGVWVPAAILLPLAAVIAVASRPPASRAS